MKNQLRILERQILSDPENIDLVDPYLNLINRLGMVDHDLKIEEFNQKASEDDWQTFLWHLMRGKIEDVVPAIVLIEKHNAINDIMIPFFIEKITNRSNYMKHRGAVISLFPKNYKNILKPVLLKIVNDRSEDKLRSVAMAKLATIADQSMLDDILKIAVNEKERTRLRTIAMLTLDILGIINHTKSYSENLKLIQSLVHKKRAYTKVDSS